MWEFGDRDEKRRKRALNRLKAGSSYYGCGKYLKSLDMVLLQDIYAHYENERLEKKYKAIMDCYYNDAFEDWNQTFYSYFFQYLDGGANKERYKQLARRVRYNIILRENSNQLRVEALLLGASGLLKNYDEDPYTQELQREAEYLMHKYNITPLRSSDWKFQPYYPKNNPVLRIAQAATLFSRNELIFDKILGCRSLEDVENLLMVEASPYWTTHYVPAKVSTSDVKRIGTDKCNILGINVVVMLQYAYGTYTSNDELIEQAQNLIQDLKAESNWAINKWRNYGIYPQTAFEGQALLHLATEYCKCGRCEGCYVGERAMKDFSWLDSE